MASKAKPKRSKPKRDVRMSFSTTSRNAQIIRNSAKKAGEKLGRFVETQALRK